MAPGPPARKPVEPCRAPAGCGEQKPGAGTHTCRRLQQEICLLFSPLFPTALCLGLVRGKARLCKLENTT